MVTGMLADQVNDAAKIYDFDSPLWLNDSDSSSSPENLSEPFSKIQVKSLDKSSPSERNLEFTAEPTPEILARVADPSRISFDLKESMPSEQFASFVKKRELLLETFYKILRPISFNELKFENNLINLDRFLQESALTITKSERAGVVITGSLSLGLGLSNQIRETLKKNRFTRLLSYPNGFYYVLALGLGSFVHTENDDKKICFELTIDFDRLQKIKTYAGEISLAANWGFVVDQPPRAQVQSLNSHYIGVLGVIRQGVDHFSYSGITGFAVPPFLPVGMIYSNSTKRMRIPLVKFRMKHLQPIQSFFKKIKTLRLKPKGPK